MILNKKSKTVFAKGLLGFSDSVMDQVKAKQQDNEAFDMRNLAGELRWIEKEDVAKQRLILKEARQLEDDYFERRRLQLLRD